MKRYAVIGFGAAGYSAAQSLRLRAPGAEIHVFSNTGDAPANPMLTTYYTKGMIRREAMYPFGPLGEITRRLDLTMHSDTAVEALLPKSMRLRTSARDAGPFDAILLATGAQAVLPPIPGAGDPRVLCMRTAADADHLADKLARGNIHSALIVGASMTGIKVAELLHAAGISCVMADLAPWIFPMAAMEETGRRIMSALKEKGIAMRFGTSLERIIPGGDALIAQFKEGGNLKTDLIAMCVGTKACTALAEGAGLRTGRGITVDQGMRTSAPGIFAAGDCCEAQELQSGQPMVIGLWANAVQQGDAAGRNMAGGTAAYSPGTLQNISHFFDMDFIGVGDVRLDTAGVEKRIFENKDYYIVAATRNGAPVCLNIMGPPIAGGILKHRMVKAFAGITDNPAEQTGLLDRHGLPREFLHWLQQPNGKGNAS